MTGTEKDKGTNARLKLEITSVSEPKDIGKERPWWMLEFKAKAEGDDKPHTYKAFGNTTDAPLFKPIQTNPKIDCDINITTNVRERDGEPVTYTNRKVTQIYIDGKPVNVRQSGGGGYRQDSPDTRASIEAQKRADITAQLWIGGKFDGNSSEVTKMRKWLMEDTPIAPQPAPQPPQAEVKVKPDDNGKAKLLDAVCAAKKFKAPKTARTWLTNVCRIEPDRIDTEPEKVLAEVEPYF